MVGNDTMAAASGEIAARKSEPLTLRVPIVALMALTLVYGVCFSDNNANVLTQGGFWLWLLAALAPLLCALARGGKRKGAAVEDAYARKRRKRAEILRGAGVALLLLVLLFAVKLSGQQFLALSVASGLAICYLLYSWKRAGKLTPERVALLIFIAAMCLRVIYVLYTSCLVRQHDVGYANGYYGHIGYIQYILENGFRIPALDMEPQSTWQFYHPPLHPLISAVWVKLHMIAGDDLNNALESVQVLTLFYSGMTLIVCFRLIEQFGLRGRARTLAFALCCFSPALIIRAGSINNDALLLLMMLAALSEAMAWYAAPTCRRAALTGLLLALSMLTKLSGAMMAAPIGVLFLSALFRRKLSFGRWFGQMVLFMLVFAPLGTSYALYCHLRWDMPLSYVPLLGTDSRIYIGNRSVLQRLFGLERAHLATPFVTLSGDGQDYNLLLLTLKTALFDEYVGTDNLVIRISRLLFVENALLCGFGAVSFVRTSYRALRDPERRAHRLALLAGVFAILGSYVMFCFRFPHVCTVNMRYAMPVIPLFAICLGEDTGLPRVRTVLIALFCALSAALFVAMGIA